MEIGTQSQLVLFRTKFETIFNQALVLTEPQVDQYALVHNSGRVEQVIHRWMNGISQVREFKGNRVANNLSTSGFTLANQGWEDTVSIPRVDIERDQYGVYEPMVARLAQTAKLHRDLLGAQFLSNALSSGASYLAYDGIAFYGNHTAGNVGRVTSAQFNNKSTNPLTGPALQTAIAALKNRRDTKGNKLAAAIRSKPLVVVHPSNLFTIQQLANSAFFPITQPGSGASSGTSQAAAGQNPLQGAFDFIVEPYLTTETEWHVMLRDPLYRAIIFQLEKDIEMLAPPTYFNAQWSDQDQFVIGTRAFYTVGAGLPEFAYGSTGAGN